MVLCNNGQNMNEECLLGYLKRPDSLCYCTNMLKLNNEILEKHYILKNFDIEKK